MVPPGSLLPCKPDMKSWARDETASGVYSMDAHKCLLPVQEAQALDIAQFVADTKPHALRLLYAQRLLPLADLRLGHSVGSRGREKLASSAEGVKPEAQFCSARCSSV